jgi:hypothetical protein
MLEKLAAIEDARRAFNTLIERKTAAETQSAQPRGYRAGLSINPLSQLEVPHGVETYIESF